MGSSNIRFKNKIAITLVIISIFNINNSIASEYKNIFKYLIDIQLKYEYIYSEEEEVKKWQHHVPLSVSNLVMKYYNIPEKLRTKLVVTSPFSYKGKYLVNLGLDWRKNGRDSPEAVKNADMARKNCTVIKNEFKNTCMKKKLYREAIYAVVDVDSNQVIPFPGYFEHGNGASSILRSDSFDKYRVNEAVKQSHSLKLYGDAFSEATYGLATDINRRCLTGKFSWSDINGDGVDELFLISGKIGDDLDEYQVEPKKIAINRVYVAIIDISTGVAIPVLSEELFSYEMDYRPFYKTGLGKGIYRDTKLYWGDFNEDGKADYLVRRRQANLGFTYKDGPERFIVEPYKESVKMYLRDSKNNYIAYKPENEKEFIEFVIKSTRWDDGFPEYYNCTE